MSDFAALSYKELAERLAHYLSSALVSAQYSMTDETMHDALGLCDQVTRRKAAHAEDVRAVEDEPVMRLECEKLLGGDGEYAVDFVKPGWLDECRKKGGTFFLYRQPQCSEVSPQCSEHLRTQGKLLPLHTLLPHPPRHEGFLQPEREVPGYTIEQMKEYGALCAAEALRQNK